ncbi:YciI family protein [Nocardioides bizhenqiangii]|uniref:YciI family protein n=1 Tax=Nocardioides bizhenqiangii TaxID=3095076 RepID=A0ABZ0ZS13_9ACTN|nr:MULTISPECIES: YciI family protein [unclassified Nocardioides]MDZ5619719.1 YciI family protein [Nocardioides sp. HM23]WQQ26273.1 YciI family protein [Nocardioides sp. HM61]
MKFVILIHSNPQPWGHPTSAHTAEYQALPQDRQDELGRRWERVFGDADAKAEIVYGCALGDPTASLIFRHDREPVATDGPYSESKEHLAGFFLIDVESEQRAQEIAEAFSCPGDTVELRPTMRPDSES